jgi:tRNA nucleotidyltransferase/poly(A) polymerase
MFNNILNKDQVEILPFLKLFNRSFYLVGGTAIALHLGHRRSIDFDLFTFSGINKSRIRSHLNSIPFKKIPVFEDFDQMHLLLNNVKVTFFTYP